MKLAFACPYYGNTHPLIGTGQRANVMNAAEAGHVWIDDYSTNGTQHRNACEAMTFKAAHDPRIDAVFWTEHDVLLDPFTVTKLCETLEKTPDADVVTGIAFRRSEPFNPMVANLWKDLTLELYESMKTSLDYNVKRAAELKSFEEMREQALMSISTIAPAEGPFRADTASMCCLLIRKSVFDRAWDDPELFAVDPMGFFSIDNAFFARLRAKGIKLYCDPRVLCEHQSDPELIGVRQWMQHTARVVAKQDFKKQLEQRAADKTSRIYGELTRLANHYRTDKGTLDHTPDSGWQGWVHNYCDFYQAHLEPIRLSARRVLEVGVWHGASLKMWRDYFPEAKVTGFDSDVSLVESDLGERIDLVQGDQVKREDLAALSGDFDLIVDDGGHRMDEQQITLGALFPHVRPGGYYILEDLHTSFLPSGFGRNEDGSNATAILIEMLSLGQPAKSSYMTEEELAYLNANVASCTIYGGKSMTCIIRKRG